MRFQTLVSLLLISQTLALFGNKQREEEKKAEAAAKETIALGIDSLRETTRDPRAMKETLEMLKDPETMAEVKKLMSDPAFKKQMDNMLNDPAMNVARERAKAIAEDKEGVQSLYTEMVANAIKAETAPPLDGKSSADIGLQYFAKAAADPNELKEALAMMKDPEVMKEVQALMKDPQFQAQMKKYTENPRFKQAIEAANEKAQNIAQDPAKLETLKAQMNAFMNS